MFRHKVLTVLFLVSYGLSAGDLQEKPVATRVEVTGSNKNGYALHIYKGNCKISSSYLSLASANDFREGLLYELEAIKGIDTSKITVVYFAKE